MKSIKVICAIISFQNKTLVAQRSESMSLPLKWEFPGGKIEDGENEQKCIVREIKEELNIDIELISRLQPSKFNYPNISIELIPYTAKHIAGEVRLIEHKQFLLLEKDELLTLDWAAADIPIVNEFVTL